jgi:hypothetical protein
MSVVLAPRFVWAQADPARERPKESDLLVAVGSTAAPEPLRPDDLPLGGKPTMAWPMDAETHTVRSGSRLNKVLLLRLDPEGFDPETKEHAAEGVVAYSAVCTHTGCDVTNWHPDSELLECPVESKMGAVAGGLWPSPRFPSPLIEPEVPISGVRLSDWLHRKAHDAAASGRRSRRSRPSSP